MIDDLLGPEFHAPISPESGIEPGDYVVVFRDEDGQILLAGPSKERWQIDFIDGYIRRNQPELAAQRVGIWRVTEQAQATVH